jgi:AcrR family transcriptional regulator
MKTATPPVVAARPLRRDAAENRKRLLDAAAQVFAAHGLDAGVEEIARVAGVGMGTLYRRFPTKDALIAALVRDVLDAMSSLAEAAAARDDGSGLEFFLESASAYQSEHRGCLPRLWNNGLDHESVAHVRRAIGDLLEDAKAHGRVRPEVTATDLTMIMWSMRGVIEATGGVAPDAWRRHLDILVAGLRPTAQRLPHRPITRPQLDRMITSASNPTAKER